MYVLSGRGKVDGIKTEHKSKRDFRLRTPHYLSVLRTKLST